MFSAIQFSPEDLKELVSKDRKFDLLAIGLQEAPKHNIAGLLEESLAETHWYKFSKKTIRMQTIN